jgi:hypothetical protein
VIIRIRVPLSLEIPVSRIHSIVESLALNFIELLRRSIPAIARGRWPLLCCARYRHKAHSEKHDNCGNCYSIRLHRSFSQSLRVHNAVEMTQ